MTDVFISYKSDDRDAARALAEVLEKSGRDVWWDQDDLRGGDAYRDVIDQAISAADVVIVLWSETAVTSDWVRAEAGRARTARKLIPARLDGSRPPLPFNEIHTINLNGYRGGASHAGVAQLIAAVDARLEPSRIRRFTRRLDRLTHGDQRGAELKAAAAPLGAAMLLTLIHLWLLHHVPSWATVLVGLEAAAAILILLSRARHGAEEALLRLASLLTHPTSLVVGAVIVAATGFCSSVRISKPHANSTLDVHVLEPPPGVELAAGTFDDEEQFHRLIPAWPWGRPVQILIDGHRTIECRVAPWRGAHFEPDQLRPLARALLRLPFDFLKHRRAGARLRLECDGAPIGPSIPFDDKDESAILVGEGERDLARLAARLDPSVLEKWRTELSQFSPAVRDELIARWSDPVLLTPEENLPLDAEVVLVLTLPTGKEHRTRPERLGGVPYPERHLHRKDAP